MQKFYRIMLDAENRTQRQLSDDLRGDVYTASSPSSPNSRNLAGEKSTPIPDDIELRIGSTVNTAGTANNASKADQSAAGVQHEASSRVAAIESLFGISNYDEDENDDDDDYGYDNQDNNNKKVGPVTPGVPKSAFARPALRETPSSSSVITNNLGQRKKSPPTNHTSGANGTISPSILLGDTMPIGKLTRRDRTALPLETLAQSNHQVLANAWTLQSFAVKRSSLSGDIIPKPDTGISRAGSSSVATVATEGEGSMAITEREIDGKRESIHSIKDNGVVVVGANSKSIQLPQESSRASETNAIATATTDLKQVHIVSSFMVAHKLYIFAEWSAENQYTYLP